ncbi:unnamed protein product [Blepharisma stoltei]|uniref:Uncharacterized protein n=1 Tax=Blepharisma stoltei TaxID=1481888 RepID=A0AAU9IQK7_9CILI|nr:unnamed protein product [Blepharisma stoltei]
MNRKKYIWKSWWYWNLFWNDLSAFSVNVTRAEIEVNKVLTMKANQKNPKVCTQVVNMLNAEEKQQIEAFSGATRCNFKVSIQSILNDEHCYTMSSQLIKCFFVLTFRLHTGNSCWKCYRFDEADLGIVILPFQMQAPMMAPPIAPEQ